MNLIPLKALLHSSTRRDIRVAVTPVVEIRDTGGERKLVEGDAKKHDNTITSRRSPLTRWIYRQVTGEQLTPNFWRVVSPPSPPPLTDFRVPIVRRPFRHAGQIHTSPNRLFIRHYCFPASMEIRGIKNLFFFERKLGVFRFSLRVGVESKFRGNFVWKKGDETICNLGEKRIGFVGAWLIRLFTLDLWYNCNLTCIFNHFLFIVSFLID